MSLFFRKIHNFLFDFLTFLQRFSAKNGKTYLFSGNYFWRFNDESGVLDSGYPRTMDRWYGIPANLDASLTLPNGKTYFFKDNKYWLFNNKWVKPERGYPRKASKVWLGCR